MYTKERRIKLGKGQQHKLIQDLCDKYGSLKNVAEKWNISYSMIKKYNQEIFLLPENIFDKIIYELEIDKSKLLFSYLDYNWGMKIGGKNGMAVISKKYPSKINEWRREALLKSHNNRLKYMKLPDLNEKLAEFIGVYLGDGSLTPYCLKIVGDKRYDVSYFNYLNSLIFELFGLNGKMYLDKRSNTMCLVFFSKNLCDYLTKEFNLKPGDKIRNNSLIPSFILKDKDFSLACLRGLVDTDGSISRRGRNGSQFTITFTNYNLNVLLQVKEISDNNNLFTFFSEKDKCLGTNSFEKIKKYFSKVGSSNLRHIVRFYERLSNNNTIYQKDVLTYYQKPFYRGINLPFKLAP